MQKKLFILLFLNLLINTALWSQSKLWNDSTRDAAYEAQKSAFVGKWFIESKGMQILTHLKADNTFYLAMPIPIPFDSDYSKDTINVDFKLSGTWSKAKTKLKLTYNLSSLSLTPNKSNINKLSARRQDEFNTLFSQIKETLKKTMLKATSNFVKPEPNEILRIDTDYLILQDGQINGNIVTFFSENKIKAIQREAEEAKLKEEQERLKAEAEDKVKEDEQKALKGGKKLEDDNDERIYEIVEENAQFPGGGDECNKWLSEHIKYPAIAQEQGIQGPVFIQFVVEKDGTLSDIKVIRSPDPSLSQEAIRVVKEMPKWISGKNGGKDVRSRFNLPVMFRLND